MDSIRKIIRTVLRESIFQELEKPKRIVGGVLVKCISTDRVFLLLRNDPSPKWALVSGTIEDGESVLSGLKREFYEELFINPSIVDFKFIGKEHISEKNMEFHYYEGFVDKEFNPILDEENLDGKWFFLDELPSPLYVGVPDKLEKIFKNPEVKEEYFNSELNEEVIEETHTAQKDIEKFANNILFFLAQRCINEYENQKKYGIQNPVLYNLPMVYTGTMSGEGYGEIGEFVEQTSIKIFPIDLIDKETTKGRLEYVAPENNFGKERFEIKLKYDKDDLYKINELLAEKYPNITANDVYFKLFYIFYSTLIHELQHAYDGWRSKGKAFSSQLNSRYKNQQDIANRLEKKSQEDLTQEEIEALNTSYKAYLNLVHEINARYAQAMQRTSLIGMDSDTFDDIKKNWNEVYSQFKTNFDGWRHLSDKMKKRLTRRLAKAYQEETEKLRTAKEKYPERDLEMISEDSYSKKLDYRVEHIGTLKGQEDFELGLYMDDEIIGLVQYTLYDGELTVKDIIVRPEFRRQGYGSKMMKYIKQQHPEYRYVPSMMTDLGAKFIHKDIDINEVRIIVKSILSEIENSEEYRGVHVMRKDSTLSPLYDLLKSGQVAPDFYENIHHYAYLRNKSDQESVNIIKQARNRPDATVTIYRAVPKGVTEINHGDWISLSKSYARQHALHYEDSKLDMPVISKKVKAKDIWWDGNDVNEFSYFPGE